MKKAILSLLFLIAVGTSTTYAQHNHQVAEATFGVRGNCTTCQSIIERSARSVKGVIHADWNKASKMMSVSFGPAKTSSLKIQQVISGSGYATEKIPESAYAYYNLNACCKYDTKMKVGTKYIEENKKSTH